MNTAFLIAAPTSGSGKTTVARGLMALFAAKGFKVQPFKCGPDYIDTKFHEAVCGRPSINLDTFMASKEHVQALFAHYGTDADVCIVEGMMGLFDGYDRDKGSSAEIAATLGIPVVLVVDAKSAAYSMAPLLQGFINFRKDVHIAGVIYNKVGSERHFQMLQQVCDDLGIECFGYLPKQASLEQGSRYLGLDFSEKTESKELVHLLEEYVRWKALSRLFIPKVGIFHSQAGNISFPRWEQKVLLARNSEAFSFVYKEVLDSFASVKCFDPETEVPSFECIDLLYLPGGYPEKHLQALVANEACRKAIKGVIINKFRGDMRLFDEGRRMLEDICGVPVLGVVPYYKDIYIEEEDSVSLEKKQRELAEGKVNVAVVLLRHISNFTDFDTLERDPRVNLFYTNNVTDIQRADIIILPGTKSTLDDLLELRRNGCAQAIIRANRDGKTVVGICGGYQMLGQTVRDPLHLEGDIEQLPGLGLLPIHTTMTQEKATRQVTFQFEGQTCQGYEIHQGVSDTDQPILQTDHCIGTYIHGFLDNAPVIEFLLSEKIKDKNEKLTSTFSYSAFKEQQYDKLADHVRQYVDIQRLYQILTDD